MHGELKCDPSGAGRIVFSAGATLRCIDAPGNRSAVTLASVRPHKGRLLLRIEGVDDADAAQAYANATLFAPRDAIVLDEGEFFDEDLAGCSVRGLDGREYGSVERVEHYPASDMLIVAGRMVPMVAAIVKEIDVRNRQIVIDPPSGLLDDDSV